MTMAAPTASWPEVSAIQCNSLTLLASWGAWMVFGTLASSFSSSSLADLWMRRLQPRCGCPDGSS